MYTQCPQCHTVFRVTATMLKAARGKVRCGRCAHVFNALTFLLDSGEAAAAAAAPARDTHPAPIGSVVTTGGEPTADLLAEATAASSDEEEPCGSANDDSLSGPPDVEVVEPVEIIDIGEEAPADEAPSDTEIPESALEFTAADISKVFVEAPKVVLPRPPAARFTDDDDTAEHEILDIELETPASPETITLEGDSVVIVEESGVTSEFHTGEYRELDEGETGSDVATGAPASAATKAGSREAIDEEVRREIEKAFAADPTTRAEFVLPSGRRVSLRRQEDSDDAELELEAASALALDTARKRKMHMILVASGVLLAIALFLQVIHYNRQALVRTAMGPFLTRVYGTLGVQLSPAWNVRAFRLRQWGAAADPGANGTLRVRASVLNNASHAQPYPLLRLTLQDRFGDRVAQRDVEPRDYLPSAPESGQLLGAGQRVDADIAIVDPGKDAVGFEIDVCLRNASAVTCANDDAARQSG